MFAKSHICHISLSRYIRVVALVQRTNLMIVTTSITREAGAGAETEAVTARNGRDPENVRVVIVMNGKT